MHTTHTTHTQAMRPGHCGATRMHEEFWDRRACTCKASGAWSLPPNMLRRPDASQWCLEQCANCTNCRHISVSLEQRECSWHAECPERHVFSDFISGPMEASSLNFSQEPWNSRPGQHRRDADHSASCPPRENRPGELKGDALNRSILHLGWPSRWDSLYSRLTTGKPITLGVFGASVLSSVVL